MALLERSASADGLRMVFPAQRLAFGLAAATIMLFLALPGFFAPYDFADQNRDLPFAPPTRLHLIDDAGSLHAPFVYQWTHAETGAYQEDRTWRFPLRLFSRGSEHVIFGHWTSHFHLFAVPEPGRVFLFGTDDFGRDQFSRFIYGGRISLLAGTIATTTALLLGVPFGIISGYYGKRVDMVLMRLVELFLALPWLYLLFAVRATLPLDIKTGDSFFILTAVVGLVGWARPARLLRGVVLSAKERNFVLAARAMGGSATHVLWRHILPQTYRLILTIAAFLLPQFILAEITLSFLGLGVGEPIPSLGNLLAELQHYGALTSAWWRLLPAAGLILFFLVLQLVSTTLQERLGGETV